MVGIHPIPFKCRVPKKIQSSADNSLSASMQSLPSSPKVKIAAEHSTTGYHKSAKQMDPMQNNCHICIRPLFGGLWGFVCSVGVVWVFCLVVFVGAFGWLIVLFVGVLGVGLLGFGLVGFILVYFFGLVLGVIFCGFCCQLMDVASLLIFFFACKFD